MKIDNIQVYLATPYTQTCEVTTQDYINFMCRIDGILSGENVFTVSPIYKHLLFVNGVELPRSWEYWKNYCVMLLQRSNFVIVIKSPGWEQSTGVTEEIELAKLYGIPVFFVSHLETNENIIALAEKIKSQ